MQSKAVGMSNGVLVILFKIIQTIEKTKYNTVNKTKREGEVLIKLLIFHSQLLINIW